MTSEIQEEPHLVRLIWTEAEMYRCWEVQDMAKSVKRVCQSSLGLTDDEKELISDECERVIKERQGLLGSSRAYKFDEFSQICRRLSYTPSSSTGESTIAYHILEGDYMRYLSAFVKGEERKEVMSRSLKAYEYATRTAADMPETHPIRLGLALKFSVFCNEILESPERAYNIAKEALDEAKASLEFTSTPIQQDSFLVMQLLHSNLTFWCYDKSRKASTDLKLEDEPTEEGDIGLSMFLFWIACLGGLVLGYNMSVPGLVMSQNDFLRDAYRSHLHKIKVSLSDTFCTRIDLLLILLSSITGIFAFVSRFVSPMLSSRWGSRIMFRISLGLILIGLGIMSAHPLAFVPASVILGIGLGAGHMVFQIYIYEASSKSLRDNLDWGFNVFFMIGEVFASVMSTVFSNVYTHIGWRSPLLVGVGQTLFLSIALLVDIDVSEVEKSTRYSELLRSKHRPELVISLTSQVFSTITGSAALTLIMPNVFEDLQLPKNAYYAYSVVNVCLTVIGVVVSKFLLKRYGRRSILLVGSFLGIPCLVVISCILWFYNEKLDRVKAFWTLFVMSTNFSIYIWCFGPIGWISSSYPEKITWFGASVSSNTNLACFIVFSFILGELFCKFHGLTFLVFVPINVLMFTFIYLFVPETNGIKKEEMVKKVWNKHWFWKKYTAKEELAGRSFENEEPPQV